MSWRRAARLSAIVVAAAAALFLVLLGLTNVFDAPAKTATTTTRIQAPRPVVWRVMTDFAHYADWNPVVVDAAGDLRRGSSVDFSFATDGGTSEESARIVVLRPDSKLRWQARLGVPGLQDREYEFVIRTLRDGSVEVTQRDRIEGLLAPFADAGSLQRDLEDIGSALAVRAEALASSSTASTA